MSIAESVDSVAVRVTVTSSSVAPPSEPTSTAVASAVELEDEEDESPPKAKKRRTALDDSLRLRSGSSTTIRGQRRPVRDEDTVTSPPAPRKARKSARQSASAAGLTQPTFIELDNGVAVGGELSTALDVEADAPSGSGVSAQLPAHVPARKKRKIDIPTDAAPSAHRQTPHIDLAVVSLHSTLIQARTWKAYRITRRR